MLSNPKLPVIDALAAAANALADALDVVNAMQLPDPWALVDNTGLTDVTDAIQRAINAGMTIPAGVYLVRVNALSSAIDVTLSPNTILLAKPNALTRYTLLSMASGTTLRGGRLLGDRLAHDYSGGPSSEWCMGLKLIGNGIQVYDTICEQFPGDGLEASGADITLDNVTCIKNGRNGGSGFNLSRFNANKCTFGYSGALGTNPGAPNGPWSGFDVEPDGGGADDIRFNECVFPHNDASGVLIWSRAGIGVSISHVLLTNCLMDGSANGVETKGLSGPVTLTANGCTLQGYKGAAFKVGAGSTVTIDGNTMRSLAPRPTTNTPGRWDIQIGPAQTLADSTVVPKGVVIQGTNTYTGPVV